MSFSRLFEIMSILYASKTAPALILVVMAVVLPNLLHDHGMPRPGSRFVGAVAGGLAALLAVAFLPAWEAVSVSAIATLAIAILRSAPGQGLRGLDGGHSRRDWSTLSFPLAATGSLFVGAAVLDQGWAAFAPIAFVSWGDSAAGLVRSRRKPPSRGILGSTVMLLICLGVALCVHPYWVGALGAAVATATERYRPLVPNWLDDNLAIAATSFVVIFVLITE